MEEGRNFGTDNNSDEVYSESVRAGKRTYFFDVKSTKGNDYYITLTESRRKTERDGSFSYEKHKIFLYKEDFEKFEEAMQKAMSFIKENKKDFFEKQEEKSNFELEDKGYTMSDIDKEFDAL